MGGPKKLAPYLVFANEKREAAKELLLSEGAEKPSMGEIAKRVGVMWGQLDDAGKQVRPPAHPLITFTAVHVTSFPVYRTVVRVIGVRSRSRGLM